MRMNLGPRLLNISIFLRAFLDVLFHLTFQIQFKTFNHFTIKKKDLQSFPRTESLSEKREKNKPDRATMRPDCVSI